MPFSGKPGCQRATGSFWEEGVQKYMHETVFLLWGSGKNADTSRWTMRIRKNITK